MDLEPPQETEIDAAETIAQMGETEEDFDESEALEVEEVSPKYALIVGGRAMTTASNTAVQQRATAAAAAAIQIRRRHRSRRLS